MTTGDLTIDVRHHPGRAVVSPSGEIDYGNVARLRSVLVDMVQGSAETVVIDLADVHFVDSTVLSVLVQGKQRFEASGRRMVLENMTDRVRRTLELAGALDYLEG